MLLVLVYLEFQIMQFMSTLGIILTFDANAHTDTHTRALTQLAILLYSLHGDIEDSSEFRIIHIWPWTMLNNLFLETFLKDFPLRFLKLVCMP